MGEPSDLAARGPRRVRASEPDLEIITIYLLMAAIFILVGLVTLHNSRGVVECVDRYHLDCVPDAVKTNKLQYIKNSSIPKNCSCFLKLNDQDLIVWMCTAALPTLRKLYGRIEEDLDQDDVIVVKLMNNYNRFGKKKLVLSTRSWLGGKNDFTGVAFIVVGSFPFLVNIFFMILHMKIKSGKVAYCIEDAHSARLKGIVVLTRNTGTSSDDDPYLVASSLSDGVIQVWDVRMAMMEKPNPWAEANTKSRLTCLSGSSIKSFKQKRPGGSNIPKEKEEEDIT